MSGKHRGLYARPASAGSVFLLLPLAADVIIRSHVGIQGAANLLPFSKGVRGIIAPFVVSPSNHERAVHPSTGSGRTGEGISPLHLGTPPNPQHPP